MSVERTFQAEGMARAKTLGKRHACNSKDIKVMKGQGGRDIIRRQGVNLHFGAERDRKG